MGQQGVQTQEGNAPRSSKRTWLIRGLLGTVGVLVLLIVVGMIAQSVAASRDQRRYPPPGELVDIGDFSLHVNVAGEMNAGPTVVLIGCGGCTSANWGWIHPKVAEFAPVVSVDRAGLGWSEQRPFQGDASDDAQELHSALQKAGIPGPYVLVGHSYGGPVARLFADQFPDEVVGLTLVDPRHPDMASRLPAEAVSAMSSEEWMVRILGWSARLGLLRLTDLGESQAAGLPDQQQAEFAAHYNSVQYWHSLASTIETTDETDAATRATGELGDRPLIVLSADRAWLDEDAPADEARRVFTEMNEEQALLSSNSRHAVIEGASHMSLVNNEAHALQVVEAIHEVVDAVRNDSRISN
jgi:pimeloyl-ACP methyl ester carboxylesterase